MLDKYFESSFTLDQFRNGPAAPWLDGFAQSLDRDGYSRWTARTYLGAAHHLARFLELTDIALVAVQPETIVAFERHLTRCKCPKPRGKKSADTVRGAACFLRYLWNCGVVSRPVEPPCSPLVQGFGDWLQSKLTVVRRKPQSRVTPQPSPSFSRRSGILKSTTPSAFGPSSCVVRSAGGLEARKRY
jgi:hypothetical protein